MQDFLSFIIKPLLSAPEDLSITTNGQSIVIKVADEDIGRVIGKGGNIIRSIRTLAKSYSLYNKLPFSNILLDAPKKG